MRDRPSPSEHEIRETTPESVFEEISADNPNAIRAYLQFEIDNGFTTLDPRTTLDGQVAFRGQQLRSGKLRVIAAREGNELTATSVVVLENGTMGKDISPNEAYAAGTLVRPDKRSGGIGERAAAEQDRIAREAGKTALRTVIAKNNAPSARLRMKVGYRLEGIEERPATQERPSEVNYAYRKDLTQEVEARQWKNNVLAGNLHRVDAVGEDSPPELMIDSQNTEAVKQALALEYRGVALLRPEDFDDPRPLDRNAIVFVRETSSS
ncbi:MAG: hypothetical protein HYV34_04155 [Candidatus Kerfeldbacteria bacterium]|nr:hypothetical protein [Candidatus Kerfeldbacteria bacterium]